MSSLSLWTVYDHPRDFPDHIAVRRWELTTPTAEIELFPDVESARIWLRQRGLTHLPRFTNDDPCIVETWI